MRNVFSLIFEKQHKLIVEQKNVMVVLGAIDETKRESRFHINMSMEVGSCGWESDPTQWFITFDATKKQWKSIIEKLERTNHKLVLQKDDRLHLT